MTIKTIHHASLIINNNRGTLMSKESKIKTLKQEIKSRKAKFPNRTKS
ncbi:MAG: hypothetical protein GY696_18210 [Gammaproteobacteria bacterium]|nr:hypothetical protein [Gammaproteobacteria bacterium]